MKILGISGSPRSDEKSGTYQLVKTVLEATGLEYELISLRGRKINGCIACLGCVHDNTCIINDGMADLREKILEADAYVVGAPNYYSAVNGTTQSFLERWFQFRHQSGNSLWGKLAVAVGVGGGDGRTAADQIETFMGYNFIETVAKVGALGAASCYSCGYGSTCQVGIPAMLYGTGIEITEDMIPNVKKQPETLQAAKEAGKYLAQRLAHHDKAAVTGKMQQLMMAKFKEGH